VNQREAPMDLSQKVALVTGSSRGIGRAISTKMAEYRATVILTDIRISDLGEVETDIKQKFPGTIVESMELDVTNQSSVDQVITDTLDNFGQIDILVNNAGIVGASGWENRAVSGDIDWDQIYSVNVKGVARMSDAVSKLMKTRTYGKIVNIASMAGRQGKPWNTPYHASKAGVISVTQAYALELAPFNVNVNAICPGLLWTPLWDRIATRNIKLDNKLKDLTPRELFEQIVSDMTPLGREQTPEDIGNLAVFLASDLAINITGQSINVNGGSRMD
tara:strand:+ start:1458 stop:2285 length:828 start_codon:yes stop_codon:yes gene_type:complete